MLSVLDGLWKDHLLAMDHLKEGIGLRGYAQQDPLVAYKKESFEMFEAMMLRFQEDTARHLFRMQIIGPDGNPIERVDQMPRPGNPPGPANPPGPLFSGQPNGQTPPRPALSPGVAATPDASDERASASRTPVPVATRAPSTTIDALEREFQQKKKRELEQARSAGSSASTNGNAPRVTGEKVGRNDPCPCGSGKKYKKCHGAQG
jgi:preprotein translocase subunit SecA